MEKNTEDAKELQLRRVLNVQTATLVVAGTMIGAGVFKKIVPMAATGLSGKYILLAWIAAGIVTLLGAFTFAGLAKLTTESGGAYEYLRICYNDVLSFLLGWACFAIIGSGSIAALAFIFAQSLNALIPIPDLFQQWSSVSVFHFIFPFADSGIKIVAIASIVLLTGYNYLGVKKATALNNIITGAKIAGIIFLIIAGIFFENKTPIVAKNLSPGSAPSIQLFFAAMLSAFWAYDGFSNVSAAAGEIKNPKKNVAIAIVSGVCIVMALYILINYAFMHVMPVHQFAAMGENKIAATEVAGALMGNTGRIIISVLIILSTFGALNVLILLYSRLYYRMAQENFFFSKAASVHPKYRTPHLSLFYSMIWSCVLVASGTFDVLTNIVVFSAYTFYTLAAIGLIKMKTKKVLKEKIPFYPAAPILFIIFALTLLFYTLLNNTAQSITGILLVASGIPFYYFFKNKNKQNENS